MVNLNSRWGWLLVAFVLSCLPFGQWIWAEPPVATASADSNDEAKTQPGSQQPEILSRGPIHEAFGQPIHREPKIGPVVTKAPPAALEELPPDQKPDGEDVVWIPGYWHYDDQRGDYIWVSGFWRRVPPGRTWVPGYWQEVTGGHRWVSGYWAPEGRTEIEYLPRPPASVEAGPSTPAPSDEHQWVPGHWRWHEGHYVWQPGYWTELQPGWIWSPAYYVDTPGGCIFVDGFWDYSVRRRGLLFAPVYFGSGWAAGVAWQPIICWDLDLLIDHLFVNVGWGGYWFGDFYGPNWWGLGFRPWFGFANLTGCFCPLYAYHRCWFSRTDPNWVWLCQNHFQQCWNNVNRRPPANFTLQQRELAQLSGAELTRARQSAPLKPLQDLSTHLAKDPQAVLRLRELPAGDRQLAAQHAKQVSVAAAQRALADRQAMAAKTLSQLTGRTPPTVKVPANATPPGSVSASSSSPAPGKMPPSRPMVGPVKTPPTITAAKPHLPGLGASPKAPPAVPKANPGSASVSPPSSLPSSVSRTLPPASVKQPPTATARSVPPPLPKPAPPVASSGASLSRSMPAQRIDFGATRMPTVGGSPPPKPAPGSVPLARVPSHASPSPGRLIAPPSAGYSASPPPVRSVTPSPPPGPVRSFAPNPGPGIGRPNPPAYAPPSRGFGSPPPAARPPSPPPRIGKGKG